MKVLLIKTSSMGDVIHTFPAVSDAMKQCPGIRFDWVVEEGFADIPGWHPAVERVIPVAIRRWRKAWWRSRHEIRQMTRQIRSHAYDCVIDAQGLIKSAALTRLARGPRYGLDKDSCREPQAARAYQFPVFVHRKQHAIERVRRLFAASLDYAVPEGPLDYGLDRSEFAPRPDMHLPYLVFLHGTTWASKHWPESYWLELARLAEADGFQVYLPWGDEAEQARAERVAQAVAAAHVLPKMPLRELVSVLAHAEGVVGVDSGLIHLAAALDVPGVTIYGSTSSELTGTLGPRQRCLQAEFVCAPCLRKECSYTGPSSVQPACYEQIPPETVWSTWLDVRGLESSG